MPKTELHPLTWAKDDSTLPRHIDSEQDRELAESIRAYGILQPPGVLPNGKIVFGRRRVRCALAAGLKETLFYILDKPMSEDDVKILELTENIQRQDLEEREFYLAVKELAGRNPSWSRQELAAKIGKSASMMTRIFCIDDLIPAAREAFLAGAFGFSKAYAISKARSEQGQQAMLAAILSGASRDEAERQGRKQRNATAVAVKVSRIKCPVSGAVVQISGEGLSLDDAIEAAQEWIKEAKKASEQGLDAKTFERVCRDRAKRG